MYNFFEFWCEHNKQQKINNHDGRWWTYNTLDDLAAFFPFWSRRQVERITNSLVKQGAVVTGRYNKTPFDRTTWYSPNLGSCSVEITTGGQPKSPSGDSSTYANGDSSDHQTVTTIPVLDQHYNQHDNNTKTDVDNVASTRLDSKKYVYEEIDYYLADYFMRRIAYWNFTFKQPNLKEWASDINKMVRLDKTPRHKIFLTMHVISCDARERFNWRSNILSIKTLRKQLNAGKLNDLHSIICSIGYESPLFDSLECLTKVVGGRTIDYVAKPANLSYELRQPV